MNESAEDAEERASTSDESDDSDDEDSFTSPSAFPKSSSTPNITPHQVSGGVDERVGGGRG